MIDKFIIGTIGAPFGVNGSVKVRSASGETDHLLKLESVIISRDGKEQLYKITESSYAPPVVLMRFEGFSSPEAAKVLNGARLIAGRDQAAPLGEGEFYIEDLKGLPVTSEEGEIIGHVSDIIEGGGGELVEIKRLVMVTQDEYDEKCLVPYRKEFFSEIAPEKGRLILNFQGMELLPNRRYIAD
ncbi:MAG: ribosome maturation factor RimM [Treponema sp.]|jgi:16S rRNA processing protein RimM|nr:ribosome maturation factor RimM [Treponema sp.]